MKTRAQTTVELLIILSVSMVALAIVYSLYAEQVSLSSSSKDTFLAKSAVQKITYAANVLALSGAGSEGTIEVDIPERANLSESGFFGRTVLLKLGGLSDVFSVADVNLVGSFSENYGKIKLYLYYDGNVVFVSYNEFELSKQSLYVAGVSGTRVLDSFSVRNNSSKQIEFFIEPTFSHSLATLTIPSNELNFSLSPGEFQTIDLNYDLDNSALGSYSGVIKVTARYNDTNFVRYVKNSVEALSVFTSVALLPKNNEFTTLDNTSFTKPYAICNYTDNTITINSWIVDGNSDANAAPWITLPSINSVLRKTCTSFDLNYVIPTVSSAGVFDANLTVDYDSGQRVTADMNINVTKSSLGLFLSSYQTTDLNTLPINYFLSNNVSKRNDTNYWTASGELDLNIDGNYVVNGASWDINLVAYYKFNSNSGTTVFDSARGNNGVLTSGATLSSGMWDSNGLLLNGTTGYASILDNDNFTISPAGFTVTAWIKNDGNTFVIADKAYSTSGGAEWAFAASTALSKYRLLFYDNGSSGNNSYVNGDDYTNDINKWVYVAFTYSGSGGVSNVKLYKNGVASFTTTGNTGTGFVSFTNTTAPVEIGRVWGGSPSYTAYSKGTFDEVKIYSRELSASEILADYNKWLNNKFVDNNIISQVSSVDWNSIQINKNLKYDFGKQIEDWNDLKLKGVDQLGYSVDSNYLFNDVNLIGLWHLNDRNSSGWVINSKTGIYDGNLIGGADTNAIGLWDTNALFLDGVNDYAETTDLATFGNSTTDKPFSISAWVKMDSAINFRISKDYNITNIEWIFGTKADGKLFLYLYDGNSFNSMGRYYNIALTNYVGKWTHIVGTYSGNGSTTGVKLYLDGVRVDDTSQNSGVYVAMDNTTIPVRFGVSQLGATALYAKGQLEETAIWDRVLTENEVSDLYNSQKPMFMNSASSIWHFNNDLNNIANSNLNSTWVGGERYTTGLWDTNAIDLNGSNYINVTDNSSLKFGTGNFTLGGWIKLDSISGQHAEIFCKQNPESAGEWCLQVLATAPILALNFRLQATNVVLGNAGEIQLGKWTHVAVTRNGNTYTAYVNGSVASTGTSSTTATNSADLHIGYRNSGYNGYFLGQMDDIGMWGRAMSADEIKDWYRKGVSKLDLNVYSCSDANCITKTSSQYITDANNSVAMDLNSSLLNSQYLGVDAFFKPSRSFLDYNAGTFYVGSFLNDLNVSYAQ